MTDGEQVCQLANEKHTGSPHGEKWQQTNFDSCYSSIMRVHGKTQSHGIFFPVTPNHYAAYKLGSGEPILSWWGTRS